MKSGLRFLSIASAFACVCGVFAQSVVGAWHGHFVIDRTTLPKAQTPQQQQQMQQRLKMMDGMLQRAKLNLNLTSAKTYVFTGEGLPTTKGIQTSEGVYSLAGNSLILTSKKENGKPPTGMSARPQRVAIGARGRTLTLMVPNGGPVKISIVFTR